MSMFATIYNTDGEPLTDGIEVTDDAEFEALEAKSEEFAADGIKCCIRWSRDSDGQTAYWGPNGATLNQHWYVRPPAERGQGRKSVSGVGESPVLRLRVSPELLTKVQANGAQWARDALALAVSKSK